MDEEIGVSMKTRDITQAAIIAAVYAAITIAVAPISFGVLQFRISEGLKPMAMQGRKYIIGLTIGLFIANMFSPNASPMEWFFMPVVCFAGGEIAYRMRKHPWIATTAYGTIIAAGVGLTLKVVAGLPFWMAFLSVAATEIPIQIGGMIAVEGFNRRHAKHEISL
jgi:uncharacterized membrane protein